MKEKNIKFYLILIGIIILLLMIFGIYSLTKNNDVVLDTSKEIVYLNYESKSHKVPAINIKKISNDINNSISKFVTPYLDQEEITIDYHYQVNGNILSLLIEVYDYSLEGAPKVDFKSYIINLKKLKLLTEEEVLKMFSLDKQEVIELIDKRFKSYYDDEMSQNIINNISYEEYKQLKGISNLNEAIILDIQNSKLNVYVKYNGFISEEKEYYYANIGYNFEFE